jgi:hypothetical protein
VYKSQIPKINEALEKNKKAIIALGCSFVQGQGAFNDELYQEYKLKSTDFGTPLEFDLTLEEQTEILKRYDNVRRGPGKLDFTFMEYDNAFVNVLCNKYFNGEYTPINLAIRGCGNRATIKELYFYPEIRWDLIEETIVIYCPSGLERFDFINDSTQEHFRWKCMWPHYKNIENSNRKLLWQGYAETLSSDKFEVLEQISHVQELIQWCKLHKAKLIITPGFDRRYTKDHFENALRTNIKRDINGNILEKEKYKTKEDVRLTLNMFPWDNMFKPNGFETFADLVISQEHDVNPEDYFFQFLNKGSPNMWVTPCSHPSAKGHDFFAKVLYEHLVTKII